MPAGIEPAIVVLVSRGANHRPTPHSIYSLLLRIMKVIVQIALQKWSHYAIGGTFVNNNNMTVLLVFTLRCLL